MSWVVVIIFSARFEVVFVVFMFVFSLSTIVGRELRKKLLAADIGIKAGGEKGSDPDSCQGSQSSPLVNPRVS